MGTRHLKLGMRQGIGNDECEVHLIFDILLVTVVERNQHRTIGVASTEREAEGHGMQKGKRSSRANSSSSDLTANIKHQMNFTLIWEN